MKRKYLILFSLSGLILCLDQLTKVLVLRHLEDGARRDIVPHLIALTSKHNSGFAFGLLKAAPPSLQEAFFIGIPVFALILIVLIFIKLQDNQVPTSVALTTILAGAIGNLIDRLQFGYVVDFIEVHWGAHGGLPAFNVADVSIIVGVVLMFINTLRQERNIVHESR